MVFYAWKGKTQLARWNFRNSYLHYNPQSPPESEMNAEFAWQHNLPSMAGPSTIQIENQIQKSAALEQ